MITSLNFDHDIGCDSECETRVFAKWGVRCRHLQKRNFWCVFNVSGLPGLLQALYSDSCRSYWYKERVASLRCTKLIKEQKTGVSLFNENYWQRTEISTFFTWSLLNNLEEILNCLHRLRITGTTDCHISCHCNAAFYQQDRLSQN